METYKGEPWTHVHQNFKIGWDHGDYNSKLVLWTTSPAIVYYFMNFVFFFLGVYLGTLLGYFTFFPPFSSKEDSDTALGPWRDLQHKSPWISYKLQTTPFLVKHGTSASSNYFSSFFRTKITRNSEY